MARTRIENRLAALEKRTSPGPLYVYGENMRIPGAPFLRSAPPDPAGRLMTRAECIAEAEAAGARCILVVYEDRDTDVIFREQA